MRIQQISEPTLLMEDEGGVTVYVNNPNLRSVFPVDLEYDGSIMNYIEEEQVGLIYVTTILKEDPNLTDDKAWEEFLQAPNDLGYKRWRLPNTDAYFLIKEHIDIRER